jgi:hypothetical protein
MDSLITLNDQIIDAFPPGIKFIFDTLPLRGYNMLLWILYALLGLVLFILALKYNPKTSQTLPKEVIKKTN